MNDRSRIAILAIEDEDILRNNIVSYLEDSGYAVSEAANGRTGLEMFRRHQPDLVLLDLRMPEMGGLEVLGEIRKESPDTPVIIVSGTGNIIDAIEAIHLGAWDYINKPIVEMEVLDYAIGRSLERSRLIKENERYRAHLEDEIAKRTAALEKTTAELQEINARLSNEIKERIFAEDKLVKSLDSLERSLAGIIDTLSSIAEMRDPFTGGHQRRVASLSRAIALGLDLSDEEVKGVHAAAMLHDIGKLSIPAEILVKTGQLNPIEYKYIKLHCQAGYDILKRIEFPWPVAQIVLQHHENLDGSGYPDGLTGDGILLYAKIIRVADVIESMVSHRPYRKALGTDTALDEIMKNSRVLYDERVAKACVDLFLEKHFTFNVEVSDIKR
ncbi:MAG TPA: response regulator [Spirochaetota bacterium]|nr:response regulator [Spirochaetota bacterium]HPC42231.1 response regulator [Spirochaetota bacterium]HPL17090.1 response regulator [Spirochaetota bacterium]HQJ70096.1 response regulator [Spirochaetota bacterium]HRS76778.1 response regulator [Spirochaetota bacterium]